MTIELKRSGRGQALVEFSLIIVLLLFILFSIIESGRLFQGWLTVQNAARDAGRYASTGQFDPTCLTFEPFACLDPRVYSIKQEARRAATGLDIDDNVRVGEPRSFSTEVWSPNDEGVWIPDFAGGPGGQVRVRVTYRMPLVTPLTQAFIESISLVGQTVVTTESFDQSADAAFQSSSGSVGTGGDTGGLPRADLSISKRVIGDNEGVPVNSTFFYDLEVINFGPFDAEGATIIDKLPPEVTYVGFIESARGSYCDEVSNGANEITCYLAPLSGDGGSLSRDVIRLEVIAPGEVGEITNEAEVIPGLPVIDPDLSNNTTSVTTQVRESLPGLSVDIYDYPDAALLNDPFNMTIRVSNGPDVESASGVVMTATFSGEYVSPILDNSDVCEFAGSTLLCTIDNMVAGQQFEVILTITGSGPGIIGVTAEVPVYPGEVETDDNIDTAQVLIASRIADLSITKTVSDGPHYVGDALNYTLTIRNDGPDEVLSITVIDELPDQVTVNDLDVAARRRQTVAFANGAAYLRLCSYRRLRPK
jgi:uncharacterized repeat protein (TIGR01451 family)